MCKEFETREKRGSFDMSILGETPQLKIWHFDGRHFQSGTNTGQFFISGLNWPEFNNLTGVFRQYSLYKDGRMKKTSLDTQFEFSTNCYSSGFSSSSEYGFLPSLHAHSFWVVNLNVSALWKHLVFKQRLLKYAAITIYGLTVWVNRYLCLQ